MYAIMKLGILTYDKAQDLLPADRALIPLLKKYGVIASPVVWNDPGVEWQTFDSLLFRSTWDYYLHKEKFEQWLTLIDQLGIPTINPLKTVQWNMHKFYLQDLQHKGINLIPTVFVSKEDHNHIHGSIPDNWNKVVIKPAVSAGSHETIISDKEDLIDKSISQILAAKPNDWLVQQFMPEIIEYGELSFIFFDRVFSHAVRKIPAKGDFRVQIQFGGIYESFTPGAEQLTAAEKVIDAISGTLTYARVDGVWRDDLFYLMEVELIEPDLYLQFVPDAPDLFAKSIISVLSQD